MNANEIMMLIKSLNGTAMVNLLTGVAGFTCATTAFADVAKNTIKLINDDDKLSKEDRLSNKEFAKEVAIICGKSATKYGLAFITIASAPVLFKIIDKLYIEIPKYLNSIAPEVKESMKHVQPIICSITRNIRCH